MPTDCNRHRPGDRSRDFGTRYRCDIGDFAALCCDRYRQGDGDAAIWGNGQSAGDERRRTDRAAAPFESNWPGEGQARRQRVGDAGVGGGENAAIVYSEGVGQPLILLREGVFVVLVNVKVVRP